MSSISDKVSSEKKNEEEKEVEYFKLDQNMIEDYMPDKYQKVDEFNGEEDEFEFLDREELETRVESYLEPSLVTSGIELKKGVHF